MKTKACKLCILIACVGAILLCYDFWISLRMMSTLGVGEIFSDITYLSSKVSDLQLPFYAFWIITIWAALKRWLPFFVVVVLLSPFIIYSGISNFALFHTLMLQTTIPVSTSTIALLTISGALKILLPILALVLLVLRLPNSIKNYRKHIVKKLHAKTELLMFTIGGIGILLLVIQILNAVIAAYNMSFSILEVIEYALISPSMLLWVFVIWAGFKRWSPALIPLLCLTPLLIMTGIIGLTGFGDATTLLVKALGIMQLALAGVVIYTIILELRKTVN